MNRRTQNNPSDHRKAVLRTDDLIAKSDTTVLQQKFKEAAVYVRELERSIAQARSFVEHRLNQLAASPGVNEFVLLVQMLQPVVSSVLSPPSLVCGSRSRLYSRLRFALANASCYNMKDGTQLR